MFTKNSFSKLDLMSTSVIYLPSLPGMCKVPRKSLDVPLSRACYLALGITLIPPAGTQASCGFSFHIPK